MKLFAYTRATEQDVAVNTVSRNQSAKFIGGGTKLLDLMKENVEQPNQLIDINSLPLTKIEVTRNGVRIGAMARNSDVAYNAIIQERYPLLSQALLALCIAATAEHGNSWRKLDAKDALLLLLRHSDAV